jgi:hypothetical protein
MTNKPKRRKIKAKIIFIVPRCFLRKTLNFCELKPTRERIKITIRGRINIRL